MRVQSHNREILRFYGILKRHRSQPREGTGHNGVRAAKDGERSAEFEWQNRGPKQVHLQSDDQMFALLLYYEEIVRVDERMPEGIRGLEEIPFVSTTAQPV